MVLPFELHHQPSNQVYSYIWNSYWWILRPCRKSDTNHKDFFSYKKRKSASAASDNLSRASREQHFKKIQKPSNQSVCCYLQTDRVFYWFRPSWYLFYQTHSPVIIRAWKTRESARPSTPTAHSPLVAIHLVRQATFHLGNTCWKSPVSLPLQLGVTWKPMKEGGLSSWEERLPSYHSNTSTRSTKMGLEHWTAISGMDYDWCKR